MKIKAKQDTLLKKSTVDSSSLSEDKKSKVGQGKEYKITSYKEVGNNHAQVELDFGAGTWFIFTPHWDVPRGIFTRAQFDACFSNASKANRDKYFEPILRACDEGGINNNLRLAAFFAQIGHESGDLKYNEEIATGSAYEGRKDLGNTFVGDGVKYKGRGLIQLTGRANYRYFGTHIGLDLESNPDLAKEPLNSAKLAVAYWNDRKLSPLADKKDLREITRRINGGFNGMPDRQRRYEIALRVLTGEKIPVTFNLPKSYSDVNWGNFNSRLTQNFTVGEFLNNDPERIPTDDTVKKNLFALAQEIQKLRDAWGSGLKITSGYRPQAVNRRIGGATNSQHLYGHAVDLYPTNNQLAAFQAFCLENWSDAVGRGVKRGFVHLDRRFGGGYKKGARPKTVWDY